MFDPQMSFSLIDTVTGPVPPPHRPVMQTQRRKFREFAESKQFKRVFVNLSCQDNPKTGALFAEDFDDRVFDPVFAEARPRRMAPRLPRARSFIVRMLEQRHSGFGPEAVTDEHRRIGGK